MNSYQTISSQDEVQAKVYGLAETGTVSTVPHRNRKLPRIPKPDGSRYATGDAQDWTYKYTVEDLEALHGMPDNPTEEMPTMKQIYEYGILCEMMRELKAQLRIFTPEADKEWQSLVDELNDV